MISALAGLFIPFGFFEPTKFLAEKAIGAIISSGIKPMVLAFLVTVIEPTLLTLRFEGELTFSSALLTAGAIGEKWKNYNPSDASIKYHLTRFVYDTHMMSSDPAVVKANRLDAYRLVTSKAANSLSAIAQKNDPIARSKNERASVEVASMVRLGENS